MPSDAAHWKAAEPASPKMTKAKVSDASYSTNQSSEQSALKAHEKATATCPTKIERISKALGSDVIDEDLAMRYNRPSVPSDNQSSEQSVLKEHQKANASHPRPQKEFTKIERISKELGSDVIDKDLALRHAKSCGSAATGRG
jgi:hypothetical protein